MNKKTKITYDANGTGNSYGIQFSGDLFKLLKYIMILAQRGVTIPTSSHHGLNINLIDYPYSLLLLCNNWTHENKGCCRTPINFILQNESWSYRLVENGNTQHLQVGISVPEKQGFIELLNRVGIKPFSPWNFEQASTSVSTHSELVANMFQAEKREEFVKLCQEFVDELVKLSDIDNELNTKY
jgi:hypothetical protein